MTDKQRLYIKSLRESYGLSQADSMDLVRAYGLPEDWRLWGDAEVEAVAAMLQKQGPEYQRALMLARQGREEYEALAKRREQRERAAKAA